MVNPTALIARNPNDARWSQVRRALRDLNVTLLDEVHSIEDAIAQVTRRQPDLLLTACRLDSESTAATVAEVRRVHAPQSRVVVFTDELDDITVPAFAQIGLNGYLAWQDVSRSDTFQCTLQLALTGEVVVGSMTVAQRYDAALRGLVDTVHPDLELSDFQRRLLLHRAQGRTYAAIADLEGVSLRQVQRVGRVLCEKLGASDQFTLGMRAALLGIVPHS